MSFLENCFNTMLEYGEAIKNSFVKGHVSDWPETEKSEQEGTETPETPEVPEIPETPDEVEPAFEITAAVFVHDEESYNALPASYRSTYGEWGTPKLEESLPWLAVEFESIPANELDIQVEGPNGFVKPIAYPELSQEVTLLTLDDDELGTELVAGTWTITINGTAVQIIVPEV